MARKRKRARQEAGSGQGKRPGRTSATAGGDAPPRGSAQGDTGGHRRRVQWRVGLAVGAVVALAAVVVLVARARHGATSPGPGVPPVALPAPRSEPGRHVAYSDFVGAQTCAGCHPAEYAKWQASTHGRAGGPPTPERLLPRFDGAPIRFRDATVRPVRRGGVYEFLVDRPGFAETVLRVDGVVGGGHMVGGGTQGFLERAEDGTLRFLPFDWSKGLGAWFCNTQGRANDGYVPITDTLSIAACTDWPPQRSFGTTARFSDCQQCHGSQIDARWNPAQHRWNTRVASLAVDCEACHGPGRRHVRLARSGHMADSVDIGMRPLETLNKAASLGVCMRCHALKDAIAPGGYLPGEQLERYYALKYPMLGESPYHVDGRVRTFAYQATQLYSDCYLNGSMTCVDCHDPHSQTYRDNWGRMLASRFANGQCLGCHPSKQPVAAHTHHAAGSEASRCVSCHMPYIQHPEIGDRVPYARSDHTIPIPRPGFDDSLGVVDACKRCHTGSSVPQLRASVTRLWGPLKPHKPIIRALVAADSARDMARAATLLLRPDAGFPMAQFDGLSRFVQRFLSPDMPALPRDVAARLRALALSPDVDLRSLALAALHLARGDDPATRALLVRALKDGPAGEDAALRRRWVAALATLGDRWGENGHAGEAVRAYARALEVLPDDPRLLMHLGLAYMQDGQVQPAIQAFQASLRADSLQPLVLVNLGNALDAAGRTAEAAAAYQRAVGIDPYEKLAYFDLGNIFLRANQPDRAVPLYRRAVELDPSLTRADFYLARALILTGSYEDALHAVRQGLEFAPGDTTGLAMRRDLERALRRTSP